MSIVADEDSVVVRYDGATDCDAARAARAARWNLNGKDQGLVSGVACSISSKRRAEHTAGFFLLLLSLLGLRRRRADAR
jgi:MYXO-CTERM domain-containing protein